MEPSALLAAIALVPQPAKMDATGGTAPAAAEIRYVEDASIPAEGYRLSVTTNGIEIASADAAGRFYAGVTLRQLALPDGSRPCVEIEDAPAFGWRGMHLDVSRHFFGVDDVKRFLDLMAEHKLNRFHWHLTDSQGWRLDVPSHPELAAASATRNGSKDEAEEPFAQGDRFFYTEAEVKDILAYAAARHIEVVPEIEFPGHFGAVLSAHPEFACVDADGKRIGWNEICAGSDAALACMEDVLVDVCRMFPFGVVHIGGDECSRKKWRECPRCQARIRDEGLADEDELQAWISRRMVRFLEARGRRAIGWDEYLLGEGISTNAIGMRWRGGGGAGGGPSNFVSAAAMASAGHDLVMANSRWVYFDYPQGLPDDPCRYTFPSTPEKPRDKPLELVYEFDPLRDIPPELHFRVLGGQGCNWTETTPTREMLEWKIWPRACALAECVWCGADRKPSYADFLRRLEVHRARLVAAGVNAAPIPPPQPAVAAAKSRGRLFLRGPGTTFTPLVREKGAWKEAPALPDRTEPDDADGVPSWACSAGGVAIRGRAHFETKPDGTLAAWWTFEPEAPVEVACLGVESRYSGKEYGGGSATIDGAAIPFGRDEPGPRTLFSGEAREVVLRDRNGRVRLSLAFDGPTQIVLHDHRAGGGDGFELRLAMPAASPAPASEQRLGVTFRAGPDAADRAVAYELTPLAPEESKTAPDRRMP